MHSVYLIYLRHEECGVFEVYRVVTTFKRTTQALQKLSNTSTTLLRYTTSRTPPHLKLFLDFCFSYLEHAICKTTGAAPKAMPLIL